MRLFLSVFIALLLFSCHEEPSNYNNNKEGVLGLLNSSADYEMGEVYNEIAIKESNTPENAPEIEAKIIKEAYLEFETKNLDTTYTSILNFVKQNNGSITNDNASKNYNRSIRTMVVRVPTKGFQNTVDGISKTVDYFDTKQISSKDVTEEFIDLEARLNAKRTLETRYLQLLTKAKNVKEMLEIERELSNIREEIEAKQGRLKYLNNKVSLSTINITFYKTTINTKITKSYGSKMGKAIASGFNGLSLFFLGLLNIWPFIIVLVLGIIFFKKWYKKRNKK